MKSKCPLFITTIFLIVHMTTELGIYNTKRQPKILGSMRTLEPKRTKVQQKIVLFHNFFRTKVKPPAANMLRMSWHNGAARAAQKWASACIFLTHDNATGLHINNYGSCGQNIFVSTHKVPWFFAIQSWWLEKDMFKFGSPNNTLHLIGHYTQMVWAATHKVGCGIQECINRTNNPFGKKIFYNYVCNYCPTGNIATRIGRPYKRGKPCSLCKGYCGKNKLCLNPCYASNQFSNCGDLFKTFPLWLCHTKTREGIERRRNCLATCSCKNKMHD